MANVYGTDFPETLNAADEVTNGDDSIFGIGGNNSIFGLGGNDLLSGGKGADHLDGGTGYNAASYITSKWGVIVSLATGTGYGGDAQGDTLVNIQKLFGSDDDDTLVGNGSANALQGNLGNDILKGGGGADHLYGGGGYDTLQGGAGADVLNGDYGFDTAAYNESDEGVFVSLLNNTGHRGDAQGDTLVDIENLMGSPYADTLWGDDGINILRGLAGKDSLKGFGGDDKLYGGNGDDALFGMDGMDTLRGESGNDTLDGGSAGDTLIGGTGNDTYVVNSSDIVFESAGQGFDKLLAKDGFWLFSDASIEVMGTTNVKGTAPIVLSGNGFAQTIRGNAGDNHLDGRGGADAMIGYEGNDWYYVDNAGDIITEGVGQGSADRVFTSVSYTLGWGDSIESFTTAHEAGTEAINLTGNELNNAIHGNFGPNTLNGRLGNDTLVGSEGSDSFLFNTALDAATNVDGIDDFAVDIDKILLDHDIFIAAGPVGVLAAQRFHIGGVAADASDRIMYNVDTGALFYDPDGTGPADRVKFAMLSPGLTLDHADFAVVA